MEAVFSTTKTARFLFRKGDLSFESSFAAVIPSGVAAFPSPKRFAAMFIITALCASGFFSIPGKIFLAMGEIIFPAAFVIPDLSAMRIIPPHKAIDPARYIVSSTAFVQESSAAAETLFKFAVKMMKKC